MASRRRRNNGLPIGILVTLVVVAAVLVVVLLFLMKMEKDGELTVASDKIESTEDIKEDYVIESQGNIEKPGSDLSTSYGVEGDSADALYNIPSSKEINIEELRNSMNSEIYSWIYIPEAGIDEPILQSAEDVLYYSNHDASGNESANGAVYTQLLNSTDYTDNMTVIYGHNGGDDTGFSNLNLFMDPQFFNKYPYIYIYTEDEILVYQVFAAYEYDDKHLILFHSTNEDTMYQVYLNNIEGFAGLGGNINKEIWPVASDRIITLSTGIMGKDDRRLLVQAKLVAAVDK